MKLRISRFDVMKALLTGKKNWDNVLYKKDVLSQYTAIKFSPFIFSNKVFIIVSIFILLSFLQGCSKTKVLNEDKFMNVYVDLVVAQDTSNAPIAKFDSLRAIVFKRDGIKKEEYDATINYYNSKPERWQKFFMKTTQYVDNLKRRSLMTQKQQKK